jgi:Tfp pilus assembly protein PilP
VTGERTVLAVSVLVALAGVSGAQAPSVASLPEVLDAPAAEAAQPITRRRDPFRPFTLDIRPSEARVQLSPLQRYELGQLTVVGTVWAVSPPRAMLEDSSGMGFIVTIGTLIGPNGGQVTAIEPERVVIEEHVTDFYGKEQVNRVVMETPKEEPTTQTARERR